MGTFSDGLRNSMSEVAQQVNDKIVEITQFAFTSAVGNSPTAPEAKWAKGEFINSWYPAENGYDSDSVTGNYDYSGTDSMTRINDLSNSTVFLGKDGFISLSNNVPYAANVETQGWERVGPYAPIKAAIMETIAHYD